MYIQWSTEVLILFTVVLCVFSCHVTLSHDSTTNSPGWVWGGVEESRIKGEDCSSYVLGLKNSFSVS